MSSFTKKLTIAFGILVGAALTAFAISKSGKAEVKRLLAKTAELKDDLIDVTKNISKIKRNSEFI